MKQTILLSGGEQERENDINIYHLIKGEKQKQKKHGEEVEQKKLMAVLVLGQQCMLGNYKHKRKNLGLYSAQLSQIIELEEAKKKKKLQKDRHKKANDTEKKAGKVGFKA